ncbi:MAG: hypothetical protein H0W67_07555, partial [Gemmatimonadales bacterium]|nr:hypothetical protein [Gemmatimonadales bacterium]
MTVLPPVERPRVWGAVLAGLLIHALLIALVLWETRAVRPKRATDPDRATAPRQVEMVYLAPPSLTPPRSAVRPAVQPTRPPPELQQRDTRPPSRITRSPDTEPGNAAQASRTTPLASSGAPETASHPTSRRQPPSPAERSLASAAPKESEMESEARRLFGPRSAPTSDAGPAMRELATLGPAGNSATPSDCRPVPHPPREAGTAPRMG